MNARVGASIVAVCLLGGCSWDGGDGRDRNPANRPGYLRPSDSSALLPHRVRGEGAPINDAATFALVNGFDAVRVRVADLTGGPGGDVELSAGTTRAEVALPAAPGPQRVAMTGGADTVVVRLAGNAPVRVAATSGAGSVTVDGQTHTGVAGGTVWTPANWAAATDRYDVDATAGVSRLSVERF